MHILAVFTPDWGVGSAAFLASTVEFVEAFTIVLVVGVTINWRSSFLGAALAALTLAVLVAIFGVTLVKFIPLEALRLIVGIILVMFGMKWLKKALLRYSGRKALHDEEAIYEEEQRTLKARGEGATQRIDGFGVATSYKSVLLEGLEVAFIVLTFGTSHGSIPLAAAGAAAGLLVVLIAGVFIHAPLSRVPENTLKFSVGVMLTSFGIFWSGEGAKVGWPGGEIALLWIIAFIVAVSLGMTRLLSAQRAQSLGRQNLASGGIS